MARLGVMCVFGVVLHVALFARLRVFGVRPDTPLLIAIIAGLEGGADAGAVAGLVTGLCIDLFYDTPFGLSALVFTVVGSLVGRARAGAFPGAVQVPATLVVLASVAGAAAWRGLSRVAGLPLGGVRSASVGVAMVVAWNAALFPLVRRLVRRVLPANYV